MKRHCVHCGKEISNTNKSGYCRKCRNTYANPNPWSKQNRSKYSQEELDKLRDKMSKASKRNWDNDEYRRKVIDRKTGLKRSDKFRETQRRNTINQMRDPEQRRIRSVKLKQAWQDGRMSLHTTQTSSKSKQQLEFQNDMQRQFGSQVHPNCTIHCEIDGVSKFFLPDIMLFDNVVIEYMGDFWHRNPIMFNTGSVSRNIKSGDIWYRDETRSLILNSMGFNVIRVWQRKYISDRQNVIDSISTLLDWCNIEDYVEDFGYHEYVKRYSMLHPHNTSNLLNNIQCNVDDMYAIRDRAFNDSRHMTCELLDVRYR